MTPGQFVLLTPQQLEEIIAKAVARGTEDAVRRLSAARWLSNAQAAERYSSGNLNAWYCFVKRHAAALEGCWRGEGRVKQWDEAKLEAAIDQIRRREPSGSLH